MHTYIHVIQLFKNGSSKITETWKSKRLIFLVFSDLVRAVFEDCLSPGI